MNKLKWQQLAERWLVDAKCLLDGRSWSAAYYLAGYAVECGLKACVLARVGARPEVIFEDKKFSEKCWTHSVLELVKQANLEPIRAADAVANPALGKNWLVVKDWNDTRRLDAHHDVRPDELGRGSKPMLPPGERVVTKLTTLARQEERRADVRCAECG